MQKCDRHHAEAEGLESRATRVDGGWRLDGTKVFISHAAHAGLFFVVASVDLEKKHKGVTAFLVNQETVIKDLMKQLGFL